MENINILVVDDEREIADLVEIYLINEGYHVFKAYNSEKVFTFFNEYTIHLVILDIMLPGINGLEICRMIRREHNIPIIMLSAKTKDIDKIMGLATGADDYVTKPFNPLEIVARVKSQLRRYFQLNPWYSEALDKGNIQIDDLLINTESHTVSICGNEVSLTPTEYDILLFLANNRGKVFSTEEIFEKVWKEQYFDSNNTVMVHIRKIREKIEEKPRNPKYIKTVWGVGYKIEK